MTEIPTRIDPDCTGGKHPACPGWTWDDEHDRACDCECPCHEGNHQEASRQQQPPVDLPDEEREQANSGAQHGDVAGPIGTLLLCHGGDHNQAAGEMTGAESRLTHEDLQGLENEVPRSLRGAETGPRGSAPEVMTVHEPTALAAPDADLPCCMAAATSGGERCTCWRPVLDPAPVDELQEGPMAVRRKSCHDCAYRAGSPEREAESGAIPEFGRHEPFMCHQGAPRTVRWEHPTGAVITLTEDHYQPTTRHDRMWLADGRPAEYCAAWAAITGARA